ncbi:MAG: hypothetical protein J6Y72_12175, partial [Bacteroidales bacterium]|nr:hypothetical protein [Bacteroidales bacterium]
MAKLKNIAIAMCVGLTFTSCDEETLGTVLEIVGYILSDDGSTTIATDDGTYLGWLGDDEDPETIEDDIDLNDVDNDLSGE